MKVEPVIDAKRIIESNPESSKNTDATTSSRDPAADNPQDSGDSSIEQQVADMINEGCPNHQGF